MPVYLKINLPFCLYLRDGLYKIVVPDLHATDPVIILLSKFRRPIEKIDYKTFWQAELVGRGELWNDPYGTFRRTTAVVVLPPSVITSDLNSYRQGFSDELEIIINSSVQAINRLLSVYRYVTNDTYMPYVKREDVTNTFQIGNCTINPDGTLSGNGREMGSETRLTNTRPDYDETIHTAINRLLTTVEAIPLYEEFMMSARSFLEHQSWRVAVIEVQTAFEVFVNETIRKYYLGRKPIRTVNEILQSNFKNLLRSHLPSVVGKSFNRGDTPYDRWNSNSYLLRNKVVHEGYNPTPNEAIEAVLGVEFALEYLIGRPKETFWPKRQPPTEVNEFFVSDEQAGT